MDIGPPVSGEIVTETEKSRWTEIITDDPILEKKLILIVKEEEEKTLSYDIVNHNCYHWDRDVTRRM